jgi:hypothetical protein
VKRFSPVVALMLGALLCVPESAAAADLPAPPEKPRRAPPPPPPPRPGFAGDAIVGWTVGSLIAPSTTGSVMGSLLVRYDAFATRRSVGGPRLGFSVWGSFATPPNMSWSGEAAQVLRADESDVQVDLTDTTVRPRRYGLMTVLRHDPAAPISADVGFGFGRVDLDASPWGRTALPALTFEAGLRHIVPVDRVFVTWTLRGSWIETPSSAAGWPAEEWWMVELGPCVGYGVNTGGR